MLRLGPIADPAIDSVAFGRRFRIQSLAPAGTAWTPRPAGATIRTMPRLTDYELETVARACRALAHREQQSAQQISDPALRGPVQKRAECAAALAERFEKARAGRSG
jgi:hypothetical protein